MSLKKMNRTELDLYLKDLAKKERELLHSTLETIREIDSRRMYLEMGYSSLFDYLTQAVGYSNASAQRRIDAARLLAEIPQLGAKLQSGELKLNQISMVQKAARDVAKSRHQKVTSEVKIALLDAISRQTVQQTQKEIASFFDIPVETFTRQTVQADESVRVEITLSKESFEKLQRAQALISGAVPDKDVARFIEYVSEKIIQKKTSVKNVTSKQKMKSSAKERPRIVNSKQNCLSLSGQKGQNQKEQMETATNQKSSEKRRTFLSNAFSLPMWKRQAHSKQTCCQFKDPITGKVCGSNRFLQVDHKRPRWANGTNEPENLQILCVGHNALKYRKESGITYV